MDIIDKIKNRVGPTDIDNFAADIERRTNLTDKNIKAMLIKVFNGIDIQRLSPAMVWKHNQLKVRIQ